MHEVSVVASLADAVIDELSAYRVERVNSVTVSVGDMTMLGEEQMAFAYEIVTRGTVLEGSELIIEHVPVEIRCKECEYSGPAKILEDPDYSEHRVPILSCPECGGAVSVLRGMECSVKCMDIEEVRRCSSTGMKRPRRRFFPISKKWMWT